MAAFASVILLAGCSTPSPVSPASAPSNPSAVSNPATPQTNASASSTTPFVSLATDAKLGNHLVGKNGMTLYVFSKDETNISNCKGACINSWPALEPEGPLTSASGISGTLGVITRGNGVSQATYNGKPLYYWVNDKKPGDTTGQGINGIWFVAKP